MKEEKFNEISRQTLDRYNSRLKKYGKDIKTLGWGSTQQQEYRFDKILKSINFQNKSIVDIGCGFGDFYDFIIKNKIQPKSYNGWDLNENLLNSANGLNNDIVKYEKVDITNSLETYKNTFEIGIMLGLLNYNLNSEKLNYEYTKKLITNAFSVVNEVLVIDFLSSDIDKNYPKEDFVFYHHPSKIIEFVLELTTNVVLKHNYLPIPQKEFMIYLYK